MELLEQARQLKFSPDTEAAFQEDYFKNTISAVRSATIIGIICLALFGILDYWAMPIHYRTAWVIRSILIILLGITFALSFLPGAFKFWQAVGVCWVISFGIGMTLMIISAQPEELAFTWYHVGMVLVVISGFFHGQSLFRYALASNLIVLVFYESSLIWFHKLLTYPDGVTLFVGANFVYLTVLYMSATAGYAIEHYQRRDFIQRQELSRRNTELESYAHTVSHDLKNPLSHIMGYASVLRSTWEDMSEDDIKRSMDFIVKSGLKITNIIDELLLLASVQKQTQVELTNLNMTIIVKGAQERLKVLIHDSQARITVPEVWPAAIGYDSWVEEVWTNYISNAIKYGGTPPEIELGADRQPNNHIRFWVRDNGDGISPEKLELLFTEFTRLDKVHAKGHGLGLSIVRWIIEQLGGQFGVESIVGEGTMFWFALPAAE